MDNFFQQLNEYTGWPYFLAILFATLILGIVFNRLYFRFVRSSTVIIRNDPTNYKFLGHALTALIYILGFIWAIYALPQLRGLANTLLAGAGILAVAVGFASQHALSNVISGVFIIIFRPFRVNDRLLLRDKLAGVVEDITLRHTVIRDFENRRIIIPNAVISDEVIINADLGEEKVCRWVEVSISYDADIDLAREIMQSEIAKHPLFIDTRSPEDIKEGVPLVRVRVIALQDSGILLRGYAWATDATNAFSMGCDLLESIKKAFDKNGVEIPVPYRMLQVKGPIEIKESKASPPTGGK